MRTGSFALNRIENFFVFIRIRDFKSSQVDFQSLSRQKFRKGIQSERIRAIPNIPNKFEKPFESRFMEISIERSILINPLLNNSEKDFGMARNRSDSL